MNSSIDFSDRYRAGHEVILLLALYMNYVIINAECIRALSSRIEMRFKELELKNVYRYALGLTT